jgi:hypothetical protein
MLGLSANISAPLVPPLWGVALAITAVLLYLYTLAPVERYVKSHWRTNPISSIVCGLLVGGIILWPAVEGFQAWQTSRQKPIAAKTTDCVGGSMTFHGGEIRDAVHSNIAVEGDGPPCGIHFDGTKISGGENGVSISPQPKGQK